MALIGDAKQAMSEGKSGQVETRLNAWTSSYAALSNNARPLHDETIHNCAMQNESRHA